MKQGFLRQANLLCPVVYAKAINIERGGIFSSELFIGQQELTQPDLLGSEDQPGLFGDEALGTT